MTATRRVALRHGYRALNAIVQRAASAKQKPSIHRIYRA
jgi:hypothetical protein